MRLKTLESPNFSAALLDAPAKNNLVLQETHKHTNFLGQNCLPKSLPSITGIDISSLEKANVPTKI